jgi:hypothetical protein
VAEEGGLGEDLEVQERRRRLEGDGGQLVEPVQSAGGVDVSQRDGEDQSPGQRRQPSPELRPAPGRPPAVDMIAGVDGLQEWRQVARGPRLLGRRDQHEGEMGVDQAEGQRASESQLPGADDAGLHHPADRGQVIDDRRDHRLGAVDRQVGQVDDADAGVGQRVALEVAEEGVVGFLARRHSCSMRRGPGPSIGR